MLQPVLSQLLTKRIVLASSSPRRQNLMKDLGVNVETCPSLFEENLNFKDFPTFNGFVEETALQKVLEVDTRLKAEHKSADLIIGADTIVTLDGEMYGKPHTPDVAMTMLTKLIGKAHVVYTGVVIKYGDDIIKFTETTTVHFGPATQEQLQAYVDSGDPLDKAGAYGILGKGGMLVERIEGDFFTVVGLPMHRLSVELCKLFNYSNVTGFK